MKTEPHPERVIIFPVEIYIQEPLKRLCDDATFGTEMLSLASKEVTATESAATEVNVLFEHKVPCRFKWNMDCSGDRW